MSPKKEKLLNDTYNKWMQTGLYDLPLDGINDFVDPKIMGYGTAVDEKVLSISDYRELINTQREQAVGLEMSIEITPVFRSISNKEDSAIFVDEITVSIIVNENKQKLFLRITTILEYIGSKWVVVHWHGSIPTETTAESDTWLVNEWKRKNEELQKLVDEKTSELLNKNRELEIETALEKVRSSSLAMKVPGDMVEVCRIISDQLQSLGVNDIRNVQTAIINEQKGTYLNYQYFTAYNKSTIEEAEYNKHPKAREMAEAMKKSVEAFFSQSFDGEELNVFREYRKQDNQFSDPILDEAASLHFYFYSIGPGALGISTYNTPLSEIDMHLLKRFRNVFELAYRRFIDIELAIAQAREAKTEAALEKVRAVAMSMNKPDDLLNVCEVLFKEFQKLEFGELRNAMINIHNDEKGTFINYDYSDEIGKSATLLNYNSHPVMEKQIKQSRKASDAFSEAVYKGKDLEAWKEFRRKYGEKDDPRINDINALYYNFYSIGNGTIGISSFNPIDEEKLLLLKRFRNVFNLSYQRYTDIALAEAQAREAQIELALERVRARTMAMQRSEELQETSYVLFEQLSSLGETAEQLSIGIFNENRSVIELSVTLAGSKLPKTYEVPFDEPFIMGKAYLAWKAKKRSFVYELSGKTLKDYNQYRNRVFGGKLSSEEKSYTKRIVYFAFFSKGVISFSSHEERPSETILLIERFAAVFDLTYTRFNDLKKAEAQAIEAQIEAALERVRTRTMAMQRSEELLQVITILAKQFQLLNFNFDNVSFAIRNQAHDYNFWISATGLPRPYKIRVPYINNPMFERVRNVQNNNLSIYTDTLSIEESRQWHQHVFDNSVFKYLPEKTKQYILNNNYTRTIVFMPTIMLIIGNYSSIVYTEEDNNIFRRFAVVFEQSYTRFLDLQKAEAQARESQIEAALERVRSKAMAMHSSEDLAITVDTFFSELNDLKVTPHRCGMGIIDEQSKIVAIHATTVTHENEIKKMTGNLKLAGHPVLDSIFDNWKLQKEYHPVLRGNEIIEYYKVMNPQVSFPDFAGDEIQYGYYFFFKEGGVFAWTDKELADGDLQIFRRYTSVLSLTYRRYKDLKEAEAQARESKIEAAMEKVRARAMAMQKPSELVDVAQLLRMEMSFLGVEELETSSIYVHDSTSGMTECWYAIQDIREQDKKLITDHMTLNLHDTWVGREMIKFYVSGQKQTSILMQGENRKEWINYCAGHSKVLQGYYGDVIPERTYHLLKFSNGFMGAASPGEISEESWALLNRATTVFSLAYTRFLDLQKAEAQTREAQIELALERVRARTMAMHKSDELAETAAVIFKQLINLGVEPNRIYIAIIKDETGSVEFWLTDEDGNKVNTDFKANLVENISFNKMFEGWKRQEKCITIDMQGKELEEYFDHLNKINVPFKDGLSQKRRIQNLAYFSKGFIGIASPDLLQSETIDVLKRFAAVFNLTYTRFNDLQQAEAQNKLIQAENTRKSKELEEARLLQLSMLPKELPQLPHLDIAVYMKTATEVGGDYYDFNVDDDGTLTVLIGDATGHGMMSGMMVSIMKSFFISNRNNIELKRFFENANNSIKDMHLGRLMMASMGVQITSDKVIATNAGMPSLLYFRNKSKKAGEFVSNNLPLGGMKGIKYSLKEIKYEKGDTLLLMSDGLAELKNEKDEQYGYARVKEEFMLVAQKSPNEIVEYLKNSATQWIKGIEPDDDITFVVIKVK